MESTRMKRLGAWLCAFLLLVCVPLSLAGCSSDKKDTSDGDVSDTSLPTTSTNDGGETMTTENTDPTATTASASTTKGGSGGTGTTTAGKTNRDAVPADLGGGTTYYISSSSGNDDNDGLTPATAFKSADKVNSLTLKAGDNILFKRGDVFKGAHIEPKGSGQAADGKWITIDAYGSGAVPVFKDAAKLKAAVSLSAMLTTKGYRIRNLEIDGYSEGIVLRKNGMAVAFDGLQVENVTVRNCTTNKPYGEITSFPENLDAGYGLYLGFIKNATFRNVSVYSTDIPFRMYGETTLIDNLYAYDSRVTGVMLYGAAQNAALKDVMASAGGITVQNSRVFYTGMAGLGVGTTGFMIENTKNCTIKDCEVAYTTNGVGDNDGCALDWEQLNIDCTIENVYAHDNDGPFLLAMEHPESEGGSKGNKVINCISVNNGKRDHTLGGSFMEHSGYKKSAQKITVQGCTDIGIPDKAPYSYDLAPDTKLNDKYVTASGFTSGTMDVWATFDEGDVSAFATAANASVQNSHLQMSAGGKVRTAYSGSNYIVSSWLKGKAELVFMANGTDSGYFWRFEDGKLTAQKVSGGKASTLKTVSVAGLDADSWYRARVQVSGGTIKTYVNDILVDTLKDGTFTSGTAGVNAVGAAQADEFFVYRYANSARSVKGQELGTVAQGGSLNFSANGGYNNPENKWTPSSGIGLYMYRAHGSGRMTITGKNAYIERKSMSATVSGGYNTVHVFLLNATSCPQMYVDFSTDGGKTWHTKAFTVRAMSSDNVYPFKALFPEFKDYILDMSDMPEWNGTINGLRLRTDATSGFISVRNVMICK